MPHKFSAKLKFTHGRSVRWAGSAGKQIGQRTLVASWRSRSAIANFCCTFSPRNAKEPKGKFVSAKCRNQHAASVRSPNSAISHLAHGAIRRQIEIATFHEDNTGSSTR